MILLNLILHSCKNFLDIWVRVTRGAIPQRPKYCQLVIRERVDIFVRGRVLFWTKTQLCSPYKSNFWVENLLEYLDIDEFLVTTIIQSRFLARTLPLRLGIREDVFFVLLVHRVTVSLFIITYFCLVKVIFFFC